MTDPSISRNRLIAICGKGGTGKTALTAAITRVLLKSSKAGKEYTRALKLDRRLGIAPIVGKV
jgi:CO dehydrogenase nickel-insertion accessory protein CooC1